jgi:hypothetical protein
MATPSPGDRLYRLEVDCEEDSYPKLRDVTAFLFDFNLLYEIPRFELDAKYGDRQIAANQLRYRGGIKLDEEDQLTVEALRHDSPLQFTVVAGATAASAAALWTVVQAVFAIRNAGLNREKLQLEVDKIRLEVAKSFSEAKKRDEPLLIDRGTLEAIEGRLRQRDVENTRQRIINRLNKNSIRIREVTFEAIERFKK